MAFTEMDSVLNKLTEKLLQEEQEEISSEEVRDRVWSLVCMLKRLRPFVMEVERKELAEMKKLKWEFVEIVNEAEDAVDSYVSPTANIREMENIMSASSKDEEDDMKGGDKLISKIEEMRWRLKLWHKRFLTSTASFSSVVPHKEDDMVVVGFENEVTAVIERLKDKDPRCDVIPIVGPEGVGKTTLARTVYNHPTTVNYFPCRAWIYASNDYGLSIKQLLQQILNQVTHSSSSSSSSPTEDDHGEKILIRDLAIQTYKHLKASGRYLLVFDDVLKTQFLDDINMILPDNKNGGGGGGGGRTIFTTRYNEVASYARSRRPPFNLRSPLNQEQSWALFSKRVASTSGGQSRSQSESQQEPDHQPWKEWVEECGGLPVAIIGLAAEHQRLKLMKEQHWDKRFPLEIWELIYSNLPHHLKPCLLYLSVFNSCCSTKFKELIIAEGLVEPPPRTKNRMDVEDQEDYHDSIAQKYLNELINRNLVEIVSKSWDGDIKEIAISKRLQLMNYCRGKARKEKFIESAEFATIPWKANRIAVQGWYGNYFAPKKANSFLILKDTNLFPPSQRIFDRYDWVSLIQNNLLLRVIDFSVDLTHTIPNEIELLIHLRYLRLNYRELNYTGIILPPSLCNLWNLQFLRVNINNSRLLSVEIPLERFWRLRKLKHLLCTNVFHLSQPPPKGGGGDGDGDGDGVVLYNLQSLKHVSVNCCTKNFLLRMPNLVKLGVRGSIQQKDINEICSNLPVLKRLQKLGLQGDDDDHHTLSLQKWEETDASLQIITHLTFNRTRLVRDSMRILAWKLPNLQVLKLGFDAIDGDDLNVVFGAAAATTTTTDHIHGRQGCCFVFGQLKCLKLEDLKIKKWNLSVGAMPRLEILVIRNCTSLQTLPSEALQKIQTLREMEVHHYLHPAVETAALGIQECIDKDRFQLRLKKLSTPSL